MAEGEVTIEFSASCTVREALEKSLKITRVCGGEAVYFNINGVDFVITPKSNIEQEEREYEAVLPLVMKRMREERRR